MAKARSLWGVFAGAALFLSACGGAQLGDTTGGTLGGDGNGGEAGLPATLTVTPSQNTAFADGTSTVLITAELTDATGAPIRGRTLTFTTNAGILTAATAATNADGVAQVFLRAPTQQGTATVIVRESETGITGATTVEFLSGLVNSLVGELSPTKLAPRAVASFTVTALDASNNPVSGQTITFDTVPFGVGGSFTPVTVTTDENGRAVSTFEVGQNTDVFTLRGRTASGLEATAQLTVATQGGLLLSVTPSQPSIPADGQSTVVISAVLTDSNEVPRAGQTIEFVTNAGTFVTGATPPPTRVTTTTDPNGRAEATLRSSSVGGIATVTARETGTSVSGATAVRFDSGSAAQLTTVLEFAQIATRSTSKFTATVKDSNGNPVTGEIISFDVASGGGTFAQASVSTDSNGRAEAVYTASATPGTVTLRARTAGGLTSTAQLAVIQSDFITVTAAPASTSADGNSVVQITATLEDANNNPIPNRTIIFAAGLGTLSAGTALTNNEGVARVSLRAPTTIGTSSVTARADSGGVSGSVAVEFTAGTAASLVFSVSVSQFRPGDTATTTATVRDQFGNPVAGTDVSFSVSPEDCGAFAPSEAITGTTGVASSTFTAGSTPGTCTVSASGGGLNASRSISVVLGVTGITVLSSAPTLQSSAETSGEGVTITAQVRKEGNLPVVGVTVSFSASSGLIQPLDGGVTDASGIARAILTTGGDPSIRRITVTARNESIDGSVAVDVVGTQLSLDGPRSIQAGEANTYVVTLTDAVGAPIPNRTVTITASSGTPQPSTVTTDAQGKANFTFTAAGGALVTLTANALGVSPPPSIDITVSADSLVFVPTTDDPVPTCAAPRQLAELGDIELDPVTTPLRVLWCRGDTPVASQPVNFSTTRGQFGAGGPTSIQVTTDANGFATVTIPDELRAAQAGPYTVQAVGNDPNPDPVATGEPASTPFVTASGEFVATNPTVVELQADPTIIGITQQSTLQATVRDPANNLVKNATVNFSLNDVTGGTLSTGSAVTDSQGRASVVYTASDTTSAQDGVRITATVTQIVFNGDIRPVSPSPQDVALLTVGGQSLRIVLGTGNEIRESEDTTRYELPYTAIVSDAAGNPAPSAELNLSGFAEEYGKGYYVRIDDLWTPFYTALCANEDVNENGILDTVPVDEDINNNGVLDPSAPVALPLNPALDANGIAEFDIVYPQDRGNWITLFRLRARARASGTEATETARFLLPISAADAAGTGSPPGQPSPFGQVARCDLTDDQVPTVEFRADSRAAGVAEDGSGSSVTLTVTASKTFSEDVTIPLSYFSALCTGEDFSFQSSVTIVAGTTESSFVFSSTLDTDDEPDCNVSVQLGSPTTDNALVGSNPTAVVTINDNDP